jgi:hypothetical protein
MTISVFLAVVITLTLIGVFVGRAGRAWLVDNDRRITRFVDDAIGERGAS